MALSSEIQKGIIEYLSDMEKHGVQDIKLFLAQTGLDDYTEGQFAGSINTLLRNRKIYKIERGVYSMNQNQVDGKKKCFVVCPIGEEGTPTRKESDQLYKHIIMPVCEACGFVANRVDQQNDANPITQTIIESLETAELVIADISNHNPNVFYEMGYRARTQKPMIHLKRKGETIPFDIATIRTLEYDLNDLDNVEYVKGKLKLTIESFTYENDDGEEDESTDGAPVQVMPILYQILDSVQDIKKELNGFNEKTIGAIIAGVRNSEPSVSPDTALQMQLMQSLMQNPDGFMNLLKFSNMLESQQNSRKK